MGSWDTNSSLTGLPKPGKVVIGVLILLFTVWLMFAMAVNWGGASLRLFELFCGNQEALLDGQLWRLVTAAFMHEPSGSISHILWAMVGFYFLTPSLEQRFGGARLTRFLLSSAVFAYTFQFLCLLVLPASVGARLVGNEYWFGPGNLVNEPFESMPVGTPVQFIPEVAAEGRQAKRVSVGRHRFG